jgi:rhodanese-related sulfurtransferase
MASHDAAREAAKLGYANVSVMPDGIRGWRKAGWPVERSAM